MSFAEDDLSRDGFLGGRLHLWQPRRGYRAATDPVLLAAFVPAQGSEKVLDLGCGAGAAALCLAARVGGLDLHGLEVQHAYAELARRNAAENGVAFNVHEADLRHPPAALREIGFDHVLANPPYHAPGAAVGAVDAGKDRANREGDATLVDWIGAGLRRLIPGGRLTLIHRAARLPEILAALYERAGGIEILPLASRPDRPAGRILLRARKGSAGPLTLHPPLILHAGDGYGNGYTARGEDILRGAGAI